MIGETAAGDSDEFRREWIHPVEQVRHRVSLKRILAPTDLTIDSRKALDYAITVAEHFNAQVTLLHAYVAPEPEGYSREINDYGLRTRLGMPWIRSTDQPSIPHPSPISSLSGVASAPIKGISRERENCLREVLPRVANSRPRRALSSRCDHDFGLQPRAKRRSRHQPG
jgi:Universal stress protein family